MSSVVGIGGESIIMENNSDSETVLKVAQVCGKADLPAFILEEFGIKIDIIHRASAYDHNRQNELTANDLQHKNIISYRNSMFEAIGDNVFHITGMKQNLM